MYIAVGNTILRGETLAALTPVVGIPTPVDTHDISYQSTVENSTAILVLANGLLIADDSSNMVFYRSVDGGATWTIVGGQAGNGSRMIVFQDAFIVVGTNDDNQDVIWRSDDDGATWTTVYQTAATGGQTALFSDVAKNDDTHCIAVGSNGNNTAANRRLIVESDDGITWTLATYGAGTFRDFRSAAYSPDLTQWAVSASQFQSSASRIGDSGSWSAHNIATVTATTRRSMAWGNAAFIVIDDDGTVYYTADGTAPWDTPTTPAGFSGEGGINGLRFVNSLFFLLQANPGGFSSIFSSPGLDTGDILWTEVDLGVDYALVDIFFTASAPAPVISDVETSDITTAEALVTWTTDIPSTSQVQYGTTDSYGRTTVLDTSLVTDHSVLLAGLLAGTTYHYEPLSTA